MINRLLEGSNVQSVALERRSLYLMVVSEAVFCCAAVSVIHRGVAVM